MNEETATDDDTMIKLKSAVDENGEFKVFEISLAAARMSDLVSDAAGEFLSFPCSTNECR